MPYASRKQQRWAHTAAGTRALGGPAKVHEWDEATKRMGYGAAEAAQRIHAMGGRTKKTKKRVRLRRKKGKSRA